MGRSQTNPRKVKKPVVKKWCYTPTEESGLKPAPVPASTDDSLAQPTCPASCERAIQTGQCDPSFRQYEDICGVCVPPPPPNQPSCPSKCSQAIATGVCDPSCDHYIDICGECFPIYSTPAPTTTTVRVCPRKCEKAIASGNCDPSCSQYNDICGECLPKYTPAPPPPPPPTTTTTVRTCPSKCARAVATGNCDLSCAQYNDVCGICTPPTAPPAAYLPPPGQERASLDLRSGADRSFTGAQNSIALPPRSQFARNFQNNRRNQPGASRSNARRPASRRNQRQFVPAPAPAKQSAQITESNSPIRNNW